VWVAVLLAMAYLPVPVQRRLVDGAWLALAVLAAKGLAAGTGPTLRRIPAAATLALSLGTTILLVAGGTWSAAHPATPAYRPTQEIRAIELLGESAAPGSVVLASFETGNVLPAFLPVRSVIGHGPETPNLEELLPRVRAFFGPNMTESDRGELLAAQDVDFVFYGPLERADGGWGERTTLSMIEIGRQDGYILFQVRER
jgi:hypothetical protein